MAILRRKPYRRGRGGTPPFKAGLLALVLIAVFAYFGVTKANPFSDPYELKAVVGDARNLQERSTVRMAGVDIGRVTKVEAIQESEPAARVTMEIDEDALPLREDAELRVRPRIFLEGNYFVDLSPGRPPHRSWTTGTRCRARRHRRRSRRPRCWRCSSPTCAATCVRSCSSSAPGGSVAAARRPSTARCPTSCPPTGARRSPTTRCSARIPRATSSGCCAASSARSQRLRPTRYALRELVTDLNTTARALAREDVALEESIPALRDTLRTALPALESLNAALPTLRVFAREAVPGVRSSTPTLEVAIPWLRQQRALMQESELRGVARSLREAMPSLVRLNRQQVELLGQGRALASCTNHVLTPFSRSPIPTAEPGNSGQEVRRQTFRGLVGLAGESRNNDANTPYFHIQVVKPTNLAAANGGRLEPLSPPNPNMPPPHRPNVPCETQEPPNLDAPDGPGVAPAGAVATTMTAGLAAARRGVSLAGTPFAEQARVTDRLLRSPLIQRRIERALRRREAE